MRKCRHLTGNQFTMTSNEILKADVLDIVFDNRNKKYGAYLLRKYYNNRLLIALGGMLGFVLLIVLIVSLNPQVREVIDDAFKQDGSVFVSLPPTAPPPPPPPVHPPEHQARQISSSTHIIIANETTVHTQDEIEHSVISNEDVDGPDLLGPQPGVVGAGNIPAPAIIESTSPPPPPAPTSAAAFPGGQKAWTNFLNKYLRTPDELEAGQKRSVLVRFAVGEDGTVTQFEILQSGGNAFDNEVLRVLKKMPKWKPAIQNGRAVSVMFTQPVTFMAFEE
jgi:protein TonB